MSARAVASHRLLSGSTRIVYQPLRTPLTDVVPLTTCAHLTWRPPQAQRARASRRSAAAVPRDVLEGRATTRVYQAIARSLVELPRGAALELWVGHSRTSTPLTRTRG